ncbi:MAG: beta-aspartyl-peptidase [Bacteroidetes bacterium QS_9_68_14]|nr:MAG: beta-aspartyl-peptidase [Bacteroidetes bacterium QS_9_68_14]
MPSNVVMVVHGGAGSIEEVNMTEEEAEAYRAELTEALRAGYAVIRDGGSSLDAVEAAIKPMEESRMFNSGRGGVFTNAGTVEHDASIMEGATRKAGAIAGTKHIAHPIEAARLVMEESPHVMLARQGAEEFALAQGMDLVPNDYFYTDERRARFLEGLSSDASTEKAPDEDAGVRARPERAPEHLGTVGEHLGTVGAAAVDQSGTLAAGTSTGGTFNKRWGRIGDSPITGAGSYAENETAAVSSTGWGEYFIRGVVPHDIASMMRYGDASLTEAARTVINEKLPQIGDGQGTGGVIALDVEGNVATPFTTPGMFRGWITEEGEVAVRFYAKDQYDGPMDGE